MVYHYTNQGWDCNFKMKIAMHLEMPISVYYPGKFVASVVDINCINHNSSGGILPNEDE